MSASGKSLLGLWLYRSGEDGYGLAKTSKGPESLPNGPPSEGERISIIFTLKNQVGDLMRALQAFQDLGINVLHIESRPSEKSPDAQADFLVDVKCDPQKMEQLSRLLRREVQTLVIGKCGSVEDEFSPPTPMSATASFGKNGNATNGKQMLMEVEEIKLIFYCF